jgi:hypothetical protein
MAKYIVTIWPYVKNNGEIFPSFTASFTNEGMAKEEAITYKKVYPNGRTRVEKFVPEMVYDSLTDS